MAGQRAAFEGGGRIGLPGPIRRGAGPAPARPAGSSQALAAGSAAMFAKLLQEAIFALAGLAIAMTLEPPMGVMVPAAAIRTPNSVSVSWCGSA
ncbi:MAG: hypothetical protein ACK52U_07065 [Synechococcaceae cyanobacterium]